MRSYGPFLGFLPIFPPHEIDLHHCQQAARGLSFRPILITFSRSTFLWTYLLPICNLQRGHHTRENIIFSTSVGEFRNGCFKIPAAIQQQFILGNLLVGLAQRSNYGENIAGETEWKIWQCRRMCGCVCALVCCLAHLLVLGQLACILDSCTWTCTRLSLCKSIVAAVNCSMLYICFCFCVLIIVFNWMSGIWV